MKEAERLLEQQPKMPPAWKRNIRAFLWRCYKQEPHIANWAWVVQVFQMGWCKHAPFRYFKLVLLNPRKFKIMGAHRFYTPAQTFRWLVKVKGWVAARTWAKRTGFRGKAHPSAIMEEGDREIQEAATRFRARVIQKRREEALSFEAAREEFRYRRKLLLCDSE